MPGELIYGHRVQIMQETEYGVALDMLVGRGAAARARVSTWRPHWFAERLRSLSWWRWLLEVPRIYWLPLVRHMEP
jgi:hypothetical protein